MIHSYLLSAFAACALSSAAQDATPAAELAPEFAVAEQGPFSVVIDLSGTFDEPSAIELAYEPEVYSGELVIAGVEQPDTVIAGQWLVKFETKKIDEQIVQAQMDLEMARTSFARQVEEAKHKGEASAIELKSKQMAYENAEQTLLTFKDVLMPMKIAEAELGIQSSKDRLEDSVKQFAQLLKMYDSDDLVEETEEIVISRERRSLEQARTRLTFSLRRHDLFKDVTIQRELNGYEFDYRKASNAWELAQIVASTSASKTQGAVEKARLQLKLQERSFKQLEADRERMTIHAPAAGIAVPGQLVRGKWTRLDENARSLRVGEKVSAGKVLFTIVQPGPKLVRTTIPEANVLAVKAGQEATFTPAASAKSKFEGEVISVARVSADGNYDAWLAADSSDSRLIAGNSCTIQLVTAEMANAVSVPSRAVSRKGGSDWVHVKREGGGEVDSRQVRTGAESQGRTVILSGLKAGESVRLDGLKGAGK